MFVDYMAKVLIKKANEKSACIDTKKNQCYRLAHASSCFINRTPTMEQKKEQQPCKTVLKFRSDPLIAGHWLSSSVLPAGCFARSSAEIGGRDLREAAILVHKIGHDLGCFSKLIDLREIGWHHPPKHISITLCE